MKKVSLKLKVFISIILVLPFCIVFAFKPIPSTEISVAVNSSEYEEFASAINLMSTQYPVPENAIIFLDKERDLTRDADGSYWVTEQVFKNSIGVDDIATSYETNLKLLSNQDEIYELTVLAAENNYQVTVDESSVVLTRKFASRRLIISATTPINDFYGAVGVANYRTLYILQYATEEETQNAYNFYLKQPELDVWTDDYCWVDEGETNPQALMPLGLGDAYSYKTWGAEAMHVDDYSKYLNNLVSAENTSYTELPEVVVVVVDTGIDTDHPWFADRFLRDENGEIIGIGYKEGEKDSIEDDDGHGTHCAGIICDMTLSNVKILPIKFMYKHNDGKTYGSSLDAMLGILYSIGLSDTQNLVAINMSFGSEGSGIYDSIIDSAYENGIFSVAAAGNDSADASTHHPSNVAKAITVSSIDKDNNKASSSNFGETVDVCAPGVSINSASITGSTTYMSGTSMATPHIAAYIALLKSDPSKNYTMTDIENILYGKYNGINTVYDLGNAGKDIYFGYGLPHLDGLTPDYTVVNVLSTNHGAVSPIGSSIYLENRDNIVLSINPDENYQAAGVYLNGRHQQNTRKITKYTLPEPTERFMEYDIQVTFEPAETSYKVKHYLEPLYDLNNQNTIPDYSEYVLQEIENFESKFFSLTKAAAKNYTGFTPVNFNQQTITNDNTVINIYYKRNQYSFSIEDPGAGLENIVGPGKYLYGDVVIMSSSLKIPYDGIIWETDNDKIEGFSYNLLNQTFIMPAMDVKLTAQPKFKKFLLNVKTYGKGEVTPNSRMVNYGDSIKFQFTPETEYKVNTVYLNGTEVELDALTYTLDDVTSYVELIVYFTKIIDGNLSDDIIEGKPENNEEQPGDDFHINSITSDSNYLNLAVISGTCGVTIAILFCVVGLCILSKKR